MSIASGTTTEPAGARAAFYPDSFWRSLKQLNAFRFLLAVLFCLAALFSEPVNVLAPNREQILLLVAVVYLAAAFAYHLTLRLRRPDFGHQLIAHLLTDIAVIAVFLHLGGGNTTFLGLLLTVPMAAAGLHPRTRTMLILATLASLTVLTEQGLLALALGDITSRLLRTLLLSVGFFTVAGISHVLAQGSLAAARTAREKERQAVELQRINAKVIQDLPNGVLVLGPDGQVLLANQQAERLLACSMAAPRTLAACQPDLARAWREWAHADGNDIALFQVGEDKRLRARLLDLGAARSDGAVVFIEDMSELEQEAMHMKLAALGRLTANLAHEIRNPLSAIGHASQLLREDAAESPGMKRLTRIIETNVTRLNYLVEDVLSLSRRDRLDREAIPVAEFLADFVAEFEQSEAIPGQVIDLDAAPGCRLVFDRVHLHQILWNLCRNAIRHCSRGPGSIRVSALEAGHNALIEIYNDGPGIPLEIRMRLFEPFYSTDKAGTGLGLYIAQELAEANDGQLRCIEQAQGVLFRLSGRRADDAHAAPDTNTGMAGARDQQR